MQISTVLDHVDSGHMALPQFQRGFVWNRDQVRGLMFSLYKRHPVGSLLVWVTKSEAAETRGDGGLAPGMVKLLVDGRVDMCDSCPDVTVYEGQFVYSCRMDEYRRFGGLMIRIREDGAEAKEDTKSVRKKKCRAGPV